MKWITLILLFAVPSFAKDKPTCTRNELQLKSCFLKCGRYSLRFYNDKIVMDDSIHHTILDFPYEDALQWSELKMHKFKDRIVLTSKVWRKNDKAADVQSLHWVVQELLPREMKIVTDHVVQKRRETQIENQPGFINDPLSFHQIKLENKEKLRWFAGRHSDVF